MIRTLIIGHLAHNNKLFSRTCVQCGGIYTNDGPVVCPTCNNPLVSITAKNGRAMMVSEGTIYPLMTQEQKDRDAQSRAKRRNSMEITYRFVLLSFADPESGVVVEPPIHQYLTKGRQIMVETNRNPIVSQFKANDETIKCEVRLSVLTNEGDFIKLLGRKESMENLTSPEPVPVQPAVQNDQPGLIRDAALSKAVEDATAAFHDSLVQNSVQATGVEEPVVIQNQTDDGFDDVGPF